MKPRLQSLGILVFFLKWTSLLATCPTSKCQLRIDCESAQDSLGGPTRFPIPEVTLGSPGSVTCSSGEPITHWERTGNGNDVIISETSRTLTINSVNASDEGFYICHYMENSVARSSNAGCILVQSIGEFRSPNPSDVMLGYEGETLTLPTNIVFSGGGPCNCWRPIESVALVDLDTTQMSTSIYFCFLRVSSGTPRVCRDTDMFTTSPNASTLSDENRLDFSLVFRNLSMSDNSTYSYILLYSGGAQSDELRKDITVGVLDATPPPTTTMMPTGDVTFTGEPSANTTSGNSGSPDRAVSVNSVGLGVGLALALTVVVLTVVFLVAIVLYYRTARGKGRWQKQEINGKENSLHDTLIVTHSLGQPALDDKGRPLSFAEPFPDDLGGRQNSETKDI